MNTVDVKDLKVVVAVIKSWFPDFDTDETVEFAVEILEALDQVLRSE